MKRIIMVLLALCFAAAWAEAAPVAPAAPDKITYLEVPPHKEPGEWLAFEAQIAADIPPMLFMAEWYGFDYVDTWGGDYYDEVNVYAMTIYEGHRIVQSLELQMMEAPLWIEEGDVPRYDVHGPAISLEDINGDGYLDIRVLYWVMPCNLYYHFYLWNPELQCFEWVIEANGEPFTLCDYAVYPDEKMITSYFDDEYIWGSCKLYQWENNRPRLLRASHWDEADDDDDYLIVLRVYDLTLPVPDQDEDADPWSFDDRQLISEQTMKAGEATKEHWVDALFQGLDKPAGARIF